jgi:hypothetical protein
MYFALSDAPDGTGISHGTVFSYPRKAKVLPKDVFLFRRNYFLFSLVFYGDLPRLGKKGGGEGVFFPKC